MRIFCSSIRRDPFQVQPLVFKWSFYKMTFSLNTKFYRQKIFLNTGITFLASICNKSWCATISSKLSWRDYAAYSKLNSLSNYEPKAKRKILIAIGKWSNTDAGLLKRFYNQTAEFKRALLNRDLKTRKVRRLKSEEKKAKYLKLKEIIWS